MSTPPRPPGDLTPEKQALLALRKMRARVEEVERASAEPIAIIGLACKFPGGATTPDAYWQLLHEGRDAVTEVPRNRWDIDAFYDPDPDAPGKMYTRRGAFLQDVDLFDAQHFGITPREARCIDPQQRLLLELTWEALERSGYAPDGFAGHEVGVFVGISINDYTHLLLKAAEGESADTYIGTGNLLSAAAGRISYVLGLQGPSMAVDTACSSSLTAVHLACQSLRSRESQLAIAGGVNLMLNPAVTVNCCRAKMLSPEGRCKTFDGAADGYVRGEGCGVLVLKRLSEATADGDRILALIRGSAVNQDGRSSGFTAPNELAQQAVIRKALRAARVEPGDISYIEAHGTGTSLGDPIEIHAIAAAFGIDRRADRPLVVGSVKTNLGHLESAAGVAGLIKVVLALQHQEIPAHLHFRSLNPHISVEGFPIQIPTVTTPWPTMGGTRLAGVSSFGFTGTNAHVILEQAPGAPERPDAVERPRHVLALSARSDAALRELARRYAAFLGSAGADAALGDACFTANAGRARLDHRVALVLESAGAASTALSEVASGGTSPQVHHRIVRKGGPPEVAFLFTGQGAQYAGMGRQLYESTPAFRRTLEECDEILRREMALPLLSVLYPAAGEVSPIDETQYAQPALFAIEYALAQLWRSWGVEPGAVLGHSIGEFAAACVAGVLDLEDALKLVAARGRLMQSLPRDGAMAAIFAGPEPTRLALAEGGGRVAIAGLNGPENTVISGAADAVNAVIGRLAHEGVKAQRLVVSHAFHSPLMDPILGEFERIASGIRHHPARAAFVSSVTGEFLEPTFVFDAAYWRSQAREAVRFSDAIATLYARGQRLFLEIGPAPTLLAIGRRVTDADEATWLPSLRKGRTDWEQMLDSVAELYVQGMPVDWAAFDRPYGRRRIDLPTYPFQRERHWVTVEEDRPRASVSTSAGLAGHVYAVGWREDGPAIVEAAVAGHRASSMLIPDETDFTPALKMQFQRLGSTCAVAAGGGEIASPGASPEDIVLLATGGGSSVGSDGQELAAAEDACCRLTALVQAILRLPRGARRPRVWVVTRHAQAIAAGEVPVVVNAPLWGLGRVIALEHPEIWGGLIDLDAVACQGEAAQVVAHIADSRGEDQVAFRTGRRYVARLERAAPNLAGGTLRVVPDGTYLITGGLGSLGLHTAERLVDRGARHLVLVGRRGLPPRTDWGEEHLDPSLARQIAAVRRLEAAGAVVQVHAVDIRQRAQVQALVAEVGRTAPAIRGVVHAAGVAQAVSVADLTREMIGNMFGAKVTGTWWLHEATQDLPLDFFALYSSISSVWGSKTLAPYAAANHFLDAVAHYRHALGLPALSVNWGPWAGGGMTDTQNEQWLAMMGIEALQPAEALDALERLTGSGEPQLVVARVDWQAFLPIYEAKATRRFVDSLRLAEPGPAAAVSVAPGLASRLVRLPGSERRDEIERAVRQQVAEVVGAGRSGEIGADEGLFEMGMDSLMATELRRRLEKQFERSLPPTVTFDYPSIAALTEYLEREFVSDAAPAAAVDAPAAAAPAGLAASIAALESLSDEEVELLLAARGAGAAQ